MKSLYLISVLTGSLFTLHAQAKIIFDPQSRRAVIFQAQAASIPVFVCESVTDRDLQNNTLETTLTSLCRAISPEGLTKTSIGCNLAEFKANALQRIEIMEQWMKASLGVPANDPADPTKREQALTAITELFAGPRQAINEAKADDIYQIFEDEARTPILERVDKPDQLIAEIEELVLLTRKPVSCVPTEEKPAQRTAKSI